MGLVAIDKNFHRTIELQIKQMGRRAAKHAVEEMRDAADEIVEIARDFAPHDEGKLEAAIKRNKDEERDPQMGGRKIVAVWVDPDMEGSGGGRNEDGEQVSGWKVGMYAMKMHEGLAPYGSGRWNARPGTTNKGPQAGGKFFERAIDLVKGKVTDRIMGLLRRQKLL